MLAINLHRHVRLRVEAMRFFSRQFYLTEVKRRSIIHRSKSRFVRLNLLLIVLRRFARAFLQKRADKWCARKERIEKTHLQPLTPLKPMRNLFDAVRSKQLVENDTVEQRHQQLLAMDAHLALMDYESLDTSAGSTPSERHEDWRSAADLVISSNPPRSVRHLYTSNQT